VVQKIAVTLERDRVRQRKYPNLSRALQLAIGRLSEKERRRRLTRELAKLNRREEQRMAEGF